MASCRQAGLRGSGTLAVRMVHSRKTQHYKALDEVDIQAAQVARSKKVHLVRMYVYSLAAATV